MLIRSRERACSSIPLWSELIARRAASFCVWNFKDASLGLADTKSKALLTSKTGTDLWTMGLGLEIPFTRREVLLHFPNVITISWHGRQRLPICEVWCDQEKHSGDEGKTGSQAPCLEGNKRDLHPFGNTSCGTGSRLPHNLFEYRISWGCWRWER